jgi:purine nucleosidase
MPAEEVRLRFQAGILSVVLDFAEIWFKDRPSITFHDPLAAVTLFDDQVCEFEKGTVEVELISQRLQGMTGWTPKSRGVHEVATQVKPERFFAHYFSYFQ